MKRSQVQPLTTLKRSKSIDISQNRQTVGYINQHIAEYSWSTNLETFKAKLDKVMNPSAEEFNLVHFMISCGNDITRMQIMVRNISNTIYAPRTLAKPIEKFFMDNTRRQLEAPFVFDQFLPRILLQLVNIFHLLHVSPQCALDFVLKVGDTSLTQLDKERSTPFLEQLVKSLVIKPNDALTFLRMVGRHTSVLTQYGRKLLNLFIRSNPHPILSALGIIGTRMMSRSALLASVFHHLDTKVLMDLTLFATSETYVNRCVSHTFRIVLISSLPKLEEQTVIQRLPIICYIVLKFFPRGLETACDKCGSAFNTSLEDFIGIFACKTLTSISSVRAFFFHLSKPKEEKSIQDLSWTKAFSPATVNTCMKMTLTARINPNDIVALFVEYFGHLENIAPVFRQFFVQRCNTCVPSNDAVSTMFIYYFSVDVKRPISVFLANTIIFYFARVANATVFPQFFIDQLTPILSRLRNNIDVENKIAQLVKVIKKNKSTVVKFERKQLDELLASHRIANLNDPGPLALLDKLVFDQIL